MDEEPPRVYDHFGQWLKEKREEAGLTQEQVASRMHMPASEIDAMELAERPTLDAFELAKLAVALEITTDQVLTAARLE